MDSPPPSGELAAAVTDSTTVSRVDGATAGPAEATEDDSAEDSTSTTRSPQANISADRAAQIALATTGDDRVVEIKLEEEHGRIVWAVETANGATVTRVDVDARTGAVARVRVESDGVRDDNSGRGDDD